MQKHVKNYFKAFGYDTSDIIQCEACGQIACDVHHVKPRSTVSKMERDNITNLIALCRRCHEKAHGPEAQIFRITLQKIVDRRNIGDKVSRT